VEELKIALAKLLYEKSYKEGKFVLTSGKESDYYFDCKQTALHPEGGYLISKIFLHLLKEHCPQIKGVGGMTLGADPLVSGVSVLSYVENWPLPAFIVRKKAKGHGTNQYLEGLANFQVGDEVALLEDVVTTGGSVLTACKRVQEAGLKVKHIFCVLDREEGGQEALSQAGYSLTAIFTRSKLLELVNA